MTRVIVHAENPIMRAGLESIIRTEAALELVGSSSGLTILMSLLEAQYPDVVLLEWLGSFDETLSEQLLTLSNGSSPPALVLLTDEENNDWVTFALRSGVRSILPHSATALEIVGAVVAAAVGLVVLHPDLVEDLLPRREPSARGLPNLPLQALTPREIEVLGMLAAGLGNKTIAKQLTISEHTVKFHVSSIFTKLQVSSRTEAVMLGARLGLILL